MMINGCYILARFHNPDKLLPAVQMLPQIAGITSWDAVEGHLHLVIRTIDDVQPTVVRLQALDAGAEMKIARLLNEDEGKATGLPNGCRAYLFIETESTRQAQIRSLIAVLPETVSCAATEGPCDLVAIVRGESLSGIDSLIEEKIRPLDGLLRLKRDRIITLTEM